MKTKLIIKEVCASKGVSLTELASRIPSKTEGKSISLSTLCEKINEGKLSLSSLDAIATALGVSVRDLIAPEEEEASALAPSLVCPHCGKPLHVMICAPDTE